VRDGGEVPLDAGEPAPVDIPSAWAFALNETSASHDVAITLLSFAIVEDVVRVSGLVRVRGRRDLRLSGVPDLVISTLDDPAPARVAAHVQPQGGMTWVSWIFERPGRLLVTFQARIEQICLQYTVGGRFEETRQGPWIFRFRLPRAADGVRARSLMPD
jgi:hypothetical protein